MFIRFDHVYEHSGTRITGNLAIIEYQEDLERNRTARPDYDFRRCSAFDYIEKAKVVLSSRGIKVHRVYLAMPAYVCEVDAHWVNPQNRIERVC